MYLFFPAIIFVNLILNIFLYRFRKIYIKCLNPIWISLALVCNLRKRWQWFFLYVYYFLPLWVLLCRIFNFLIRWFQFRNIKSHNPRWIDHHCFGNFFHLRVNFWQLNCCFESLIILIFHIYNIKYWFYLRYLNWSFKWRFKLIF